MAAGGTSTGHKGMLLAAKSMALTAITLFENPAIVEQAHEEWLEQRGADFNYQPLLGDRAPTQCGEPGQVLVFPLAAS